MLEFEEAIFDLLFDIFGKVLFGAYKLWVLWVSTLLHDSATRTLECLIELIDTAVSHWELLVLLDLLGGCGRDTVHGAPSGVHPSCHPRASLVPSLIICRCLASSPSVLLWSVMLLVLVCSVWLSTSL